MGKKLITERDGAVVILTLNRPEAFNALDLALGEALLEPLGIQMKHERQAIAECARTEGFRAGSQGFAAKRPVTSVGR
ncbi:MAG: hypothetical protein Q8Q58_10910 [Candidatus Rokubacteria bacterium]|nr:hypothetical protein [Candidatus Rokubacteria bacterium]